MADPQPEAPSSEPSDPNAEDPRSWQTLSSSNLSAYQYDPRDQVLRIRFTSGKTYTYEDVPPDVAHGLASAPSAGKYFNAAIKNQYKEPWKAR